MSKAVELPMAELSPLLLECLVQGQEVVLPITGSSMTPFLRPGRDQAVLKAADPDGLRPGDVALYQRAGGQYVLHRVIRRSEQPTVSYTMLGDAQWTEEPGIRPKQVLAVAVAFEVKGSRFSCDAPSYRRRVAVWGGLRPVRRLLMAVWRRTARK